MGPIDNLENRINDEMLDSESRIIAKLGELQEKLRGGQEKMSEAICNKVEGEPQM